MTHLIDGFGYCLAAFLYASGIAFMAFLYASGIAFMAFLLFAGGFSWAVLAHGLGAF